MGSIDTSVDWLSHLREDGFCVVPNIISPEACRKFQNEALDWIESCGFGFDRNDRSTWTTEKIPPNEKGVFRYHSVPHDAFMWAIRTQSGIHDAFAKIWNTNDLVVSFDALNVSFPINPNTGRTDIEPTEAWPHIDQNPRSLETMQLIQGIANMAPNGPNDGGLVVVKGSHRIHEDYFETIKGFRNVRPPNHNGYPFDMDDVKWYLGQGCEVVKVCGGQGDLLLWDSRTIHWNCSPLGTQTRFCQYVTYVPRNLMTEKQLEQKLEVFRARVSAGCQAHENPDIPEQHRRGDPLTRPRQEPAESPTILKAIGIRA
ncbi:hypothetical protein BCR39DRAFT_578472 [Naematelia encephala]|uniref:Phytanoyl-CoA dioxygenase n=1 Tax=Naematelia encephala TaxID=71784 RepID=A0A1Y2AWT9_9TREE|nr:hypothetical protein BCR39DRAFT_578472 [Naematelia encephala]